MDADVIVIGAGLAGLRCAQVLAEAGKAVLLLEAEDHVGGRVSTELIDGFRVDRGFQVLNPAYPAIQDWVDVDALKLQQFDAGLLVRAGDRLRVIADPVRAPRYAVETLRDGLVDPADLLALTRWMAPAMVDAQRSTHGGDESLAEALDRAGVDGKLRRVLDRFIAGVIVDSHGLTSANFVRLLLRVFVLGRPGLPEAGMQALPQQLADSFGGRVDVRLSLPVAQVQPGDARSAGGVRGASPSGGASANPRVTTRSGGTLAARAVVVATGAGAAADLLDLPASPTKGLVTWWYAADEAPDARPLLAVDGRNGRGAAGVDAPPGPVWNAAVVTAAAPTYAPEGRHLVQATTLLDRPDGEAPDADVRAQLGEIYGCDTSRWEVVARHHIPDALPACPPPLTLRSEVEIGGGIYVCGDHRDTGSLQGALVSGDRTAREILESR